MTSYHSVINTAKNNKLIRAEIRELTLCEIIYSGLIKAIPGSEVIETLYPDNQLRQKQCKLLRPHYYNSFFKPYVDPDKDIAVKNLYYLRFWVLDTLKHYYKFNTDSSFSSFHFFYDTKKLRIYYDRIYKCVDVKNQVYKTRFDKIKQYFWTPALLAYLFSCDMVTESTEDYTNKLRKYSAFSLFCRKRYILHLNQFDVFNELIDKNDFAVYFKDYINNVCGLELDIADVDEDNKKIKTTTYVPSKNLIVFKSSSDYRKWLKLAFKTAREIKKKLYKGKYITLSEEMKVDI